MSYCFLNLVPSRDGHGLEPVCPDGVGVLLLADFPKVEWAIYEVDTNKADDEWFPETPVSDELAALIESGKRYPPALGLARQEVVQVFGDHLPNQVEFASAYAAAIRNYLSRQYESPYVLAQALEGEQGYLTKGEWYWVLQISGNPPAASWVSDNFHVYTNPVNDFDLTGQQLKHLGYSG